MTTALEFESHIGNLAALTAIVGRLPLFTVCKHEGFMCLRLREYVVKGRSSTGPVFIVPSDEQRINFVIIPKPENLEVTDLSAFVT